MVRIEINGKEYNVPQSWQEVTMKEYCNAFWNLPKAGDEDDITRSATTLRNEATIMSRLLGEKDDFVIGLPIDVFVILKGKFKFIYEIGEFLTNNVFSIKIDGKRYWIPSPNEMSLRQYIDSDMIMQEDKNKQQFIELLACLLVPTDGEYDGNYEKLIPYIEKMKCSEGLPFIYTFCKKKILSKKVSKDFSKVGEVADQLLRNTHSS